MRCTGVFLKFNSSPSKLNVLGTAGLSGNVPTYCYTRNVWTQIADLEMSVKLVIFIITVINCKVKQLDMSTLK